MEYDFSIEDFDISTIVKYMRNSSLAPGALEQVYDYFVSKRYSKEEIEIFENKHTYQEEYPEYVKYCEACKEEAKRVLGLNNRG